MVKNFSNAFLDGFKFVRDNPQIIYTIFLLIVIPVAFFFTSQQFLSVAQENQNRLEHNRIAVLQEVFTLFARDRFNDSEYLYERIKNIADNNENIANFQVLGLGDGKTFPVVASLDRSETGKLITPDSSSALLYGSVLGNPNETFAMQFYSGGQRYWRGISAIKEPFTNQVLGYAVVDLSMTQADEVAKKSMTNAYAVLFVIIILILFLLLRQARILDYAVLYRRLKELDQAKDDFMSMATHELRTPLSVIRGYAQLLNEIPNLSKEEYENIRRIDVSAKDLTVLINDILDVSHIEQGELSLTPVSLNCKSFIESIVDSFMPLAKEKGLFLRLEFEGNIPTNIIADDSRLRQVFTNIIGNAIKYTKDGGVIVSVGFNEENIVIRISDTGFGISAEDQKQLFQKFYRIKSEETRDIRGTGLGLWITMQIIKMMNGNIQVESIKGKGTDFIISFPIIQK